ncbi:MAG: isoprenylcysteine carboxylmethyltransferase family protein [Ignavibacteriae bacterium]|nr:isoprenylcysteine carboxylmethyltransferase family protein [Ignavibacteriota bacterium]
MKSLGKFFFKFRSYTPLPFFFTMILLMKPDLYSILSGLPLIIAGEIIRIWAVSYAGSETRTTDGVGGSNLVTQGPFSIVRNPLYLGNVLIYTGIGIMSFALFPYLQVFGLIYFTFQYYCIILNEEEYLTKSFSGKFVVYLKSVNRFIPWKRNIPEEIISKLKFDIKSGMKSERRSLQSIIISSLIIIVYYIYSIWYKPM